jgi:hypothetical protein
MDESVCVRHLEDDPQLGALNVLRAGLTEAIAWIQDRVHDRDSLLVAIPLDVEKVGARDLDVIAANGLFLVDAGPSGETDEDLRERVRKLIDEISPEPLSEEGTDEAAASPVPEGTYFEESPYRLTPDAYSAWLDRINSNPHERGD